MFQALKTLVHTPSLRGLNQPEARILLGRSVAGFHEGHEVFSHARFHLFIFEWSFFAGIFGYVIKACVQVRTCPDTAADSWTTRGVKPLPARKCWTGPAPMVSFNFGMPSKG